ncbi:MAG: MFS transporter, partial [Microbacteriaceae bacterium]|nr:MFS transporter [Microbacteriaceae bacterium]
IGSALGIAVLGTVLFTQVQSALTAKLAGLGFTGASADSFTDQVVESAGGVIPVFENTTQIPAEYVQAAKDAFTEGAQWAAVSAALFLAIGFVATFRLSKHQHGEEVSK